MSQKIATAYTGKLSTSSRSFLEEGEEGVELYFENEV
jgi:hypothetical protein